ncbi:metal-dependent hydrolase [Vibrio sp. Vb5031]|uniref:Metal-dependent hydrolase n=2 Tax=Vibrio TaxID=662 RepID=A0A7Z7YBG9_VIBCL|nr:MULTISPECIES: metal-dependent hydrolase [Vibrio]EJL6490346.1 metal-dependent hydrolase [Vibrio cholerae]EJL6642036.1 metal-dependent hydrolase [Vibrio cholerae]MBL4244503.1 metal-dependent hydrolase [Vibrio fluvialis]MBL4253393.1 metal-dependent hydrolase [Vibrio fluvialis]MCI9701785.1 metal-dependent hydrolase [Vibrio parahaemolyticus]
MIGRNHVISAGAAWLLAEPYLLNYQPQPFESAVMFVAVLFGSLLPDIDCPESIMGRRVKFISVPLSWLQGDRALLPWSEDTHSRGITHSIWALAACFYFLAGQLGIAAAVCFGFVAHLIGDALTPAGVRLFWPLTIKIRSPICFRTGGFIEYLFTTVLATVAIAVWLGYDVLNMLYGLIETY